VGVVLLEWHITGLVTDKILLQEGRGAMWTDSEETSDERKGKYFNRWGGSRTGEGGHSSAETGRRRKWELKLKKDKKGNRLGERKQESKVKSVDNNNNNVIY
jgi:hypothetical protein